MSYSQVLGPRRRWRVHLEVSRATRVNHGARLRREGHGCLDQPSMQPMLDEAFFPARFTIPKSDTDRTAQHRCRGYFGWSGIVPPRRLSVAGRGRGELIFVKRGIEIPSSVLSLRILRSERACPSGSALQERGKPITRGVGKLGTPPNFEGLWCITLVWQSRHEPSRNTTWGWCCQDLGR